MALKFCFRDQKLNQVLAQSTLTRFMEDEQVLDLQYFVI